VERSRQKSELLQGYGDTVLRAESLEKELVKARKHSAMLQSKLDGAFAEYHNEVQDMQAKSDELVRKNKSFCNKNKGMSLTCRVLFWKYPVVVYHRILCCLQSLKPGLSSLRHQRST
jgi:hypothetical protein